MGNPALDNELRVHPVRRLITDVAATPRRIVKSSPMLLRLAGPAYRAKSMALAHVAKKGTIPEFSEGTRLDTFCFDSLQAFQQWKISNAELIAGWEREDTTAARPGFAFTTHGHCALCDRSTEFVTTTDRGLLWREQLVCPHCGMRNRVRAAVHLAIQDHAMVSDSRIYMTEQFGPAYRWLRGRFNDVLGSEYIAPGKPSGTRAWGLNHQDVQSLSLPTASVDLVLSLDVLEHVPDHFAAFTSFARVLRPGGTLVLTVPFSLDKHDTTVRAVQHPDGHIEHLLPIELHGNPTDPVNGALCYRVFGWDILEQLTQVGFTNPKVHVYHSRQLGYLGSAQSVITAVRA